MEEMQWLDLSIICSVAEKIDSPYSAARWVVAPFVPIIPNPCFPSLTSCLQGVRKHGATPQSTPGALLSTCCCHPIAGIDSESKEDFSVICHHWLPHGCVK